MQKWKWVTLATALALAGLVTGISRIAQHQRRDSGPTETDAGNKVSAVIPAATEPEPAISTRVPEPRDLSIGSTAHPPPLPATAPNDVVFGAVLVTFEGVQGAPSKARSKAAAEQLAQQLITVAQGNFEEAVKRGDPGSTANAGSIRRGILEPALEYALFTLDKGSIFPEPIETPRGFWIMRRIR
jgi:hypothetical protein